ncbi:hypothetical protein ABU614_15560 [Lysobacter firmicutimachus]|uniref:Uncharacterized protein n=1 Tax=Lysobacter firmicutimachus TaxID=1792846 RepID=A0AAU8MSH6_9GAMM
MNAQIQQALSDSASDFRDIVWPQIAALPLIQGGDIRPVEAVAEKNFRDELDLLSGIDAWQILDGRTGMRGIASRVQWGQAHSSFTIRTRVASGQETEFHKRLRAIRNIEEGHVYPHLTVQAYLDQRKGRLLAAAVVRTKELIELAAVRVAEREKEPPQSQHYGFRPNADGTEFLYLNWTYLVREAVLSADNIVQAAV